MTRPTASVAPIPGTWIVYSSPPSAAVEPVGSACCSVDSMSIRAPLSWSDAADARPWIWIVTRAAEPSSDTAPVTWLPYGSVTATTPGTAAAAFTASRTGCSIAGSVTFAPAGATTTSCALAPLTCGNVWLNC